ncbi:hypothetical protein [Kitasatospora sp. NPDC098663]|uniref:hypothetical protein n=1 Tax=Kitasatospora sp. NPDC098663 TaxID=3364096 RepID=UPI00381191EB
MPPAPRRQTALPPARSRRSPIGPPLTWQNLFLVPHYTDPELRRVIAEEQLDAPPPRRPYGRA